VIHGVLTRRLLSLVLLGLLFVFFAQVMTRAWFEVPVLMQLEKTLDRREIERAQFALRQQLDEIISVAADHSVWDDTYTFIEAKPGLEYFDHYVGSNMVYSLHENYNINGFVFFNVDHQIHHITSYDLNTAKPMNVQPFDAAVLEEAVLRREAIKGHEQRVELVNAGFIESGIGPLIFASTEILPSNGQGDVRGTVLAWRRFDGPFAKRVRDQMQTSITFYATSTIGSDPEFADRLDQLKRLPVGSVLQRNPDNDLFWLVRSVRGPPLFLVRQTVADRQFNAGWISISILVAFGASALILILIGITFSRTVIGPLEQAGQTLQSISASNDYAMRLASGQDNEIGKLFGFVNHLLVCIQTQELELLAKNARLEALSNEDGLTGIANRRYLDNFLDKSWENALQRDQHLCICLIDIDCFKEFNDNYGHQSGDRVLRQVAETLDSHLHSATDILARYGGEEFCAVLTNTELESAVRVCERLRGVVESLGIPNDHSAISKFLTVSIGVASRIPTEDSTLEELVEAADKALYQAKGQGKNLVCGSTEA
jgi:diguanylate cyclase (GGDEF)-like protein